MSQDPEAVMGKYVLFVVQDDDPSSPDEWGQDDLHMYASWRRGSVGTDPPLTFSDYQKWDEGYWAEERDCYDPANPYDAEQLQYLREQWEDCYSTDWKLYPICVLDYGSHGLRLQFTEWGDHDGYIWVRDSLNDLEKLAAVVDPTIGNNDPDKLAEQWLETWNQYLEGDVWAYEVVDTETHDVVDSCCGFYGHDYCREEGMQSLEYYASKKGAE
jgi:hypothetical protein